MSDEERLAVAQKRFDQTRAASATAGRRLRAALDANDQAVAKYIAAQFKALEGKSRV